MSLSEGGPNRVTFDLAALRPGELDLTVHVGSEPLRHDAVVLVLDGAAMDRTAPSPRYVARNTCTDGAGRTERMVLPPGVYTLTATTWAAGGASRIASVGELLRIQPGIRMTVLATARAHAWVVLHAPGGSPLRDCRIREPGAGMLDQRLTDSYGALGFSAPGAHTFELHRADNPGREFPWLRAGATATASIAIPHADAPHEITLRLYPR